MPLPYQIARGFHVLFAATITLTVSAAASTRDGFGLRFGGTNGHVTMGPAPGLGCATFTLECWFMRLGTGSAASSGSGGTVAVPLIAKGRSEADGNNRDCNYFFGIRWSDNVLTADFEEFGSGANHPVAGLTPLQNDVWYHAAATYDGGAWRLYLNGVLDAELPVTATPRYDSIQHFSLATAMNSVGTPLGFFDGVLDEVRVWDHARTAAELRATINDEVLSAPGLIGRWGLNEGDGTTAGDSSGHGHDGVIVNGQWVAGAPFDIDFAPEPPVLVAPPDGAGVPEPDVSLVVQVSDPEAGLLDVTFYGRQAPDNPPPPFTIVALPDTQFYSETYWEFFLAQTQWIIDERSARNIVYVAHEGDIVDNADQAFQWQNAEYTLSVLDTWPDLPYGLTVGNHDEHPNGDPNGTESFNFFFPFTRYEGRPWYGGHFGENNDNHYVLFSASGMDFIAIHIKYDLDADPALLAWADELLTTYAQRRALVVSHYLIEIGTPGAWGPQGSALYEALKGHPNLFLMLCGHRHGEGRRSDVFNGRTVDTLLADYQSRIHGGDGWLRILEFVPARNEIRVKTYSPVLDQYEVDADSQFVLAYDMGAPAFGLLGTVSAAPSGSDVAWSWAGLAANHDYEWFAGVSDGRTTTTGPIWSFRRTVPGDLNCDGRADVDDVDPFVHALADPAGYQTAFPACSPLNADCNMDGSVDFGDIGCFVGLLGGGAN